MSCIMILWLVQHSSDEPWLPPMDIAVRQNCKLYHDACKVSRDLLLMYEIDLGEPSGWWMTTADVGIAFMAASKPRWYASK